MSSSGTPGPSTPQARGSGFNAGSVDLYGHQSGVAGASERCPHCNGAASVDANQELGRVCKLCGAPRIPLPEGVTASLALVAQLKRAEAARRSRALWRGAALVGGIGIAATFFCTLAFGLIFSWSWAFGLGALFGTPALLALGFGVANANGKTREIAKELDSAWTEAATDVARAGRAATAADLGHALGIDRAKAEQLHAMLEVESIASSRVEPMLEDDAPPGPNASSADAAKVRIVTHPDARPGAATTLPPDPRFAALEAKSGQDQGGESAEEEANAEAEAEQARGRARRT